LRGVAFDEATRTRDVAGAARLLAELGALADPSARDVLVLDGGTDGDPVEEWAACGAMALTGEPDGPGRPPPAAVTERLRSAALAVRVLSARLGNVVDLDAPALLGERAAIAGLSRQGTTSPGGSCRLLRARDGWVACNLARPDDFAMLPALLQADVRGDPWDAFAAWLARVDAIAAVERAQLLGLPVSRAVTPLEALTDEQARARGRTLSSPPFLLTPGARRVRSAPPLVVDLGALWAAPLCTSILRDAGARVIKVESPTRPDGARRGPPRFFDLMNGGKEAVCLDLHGPVLGALLERADVVVESSRPRVMAELGVDPLALVTERGVTWVGITAYGRTGPWRDRVGFGDDTAAAGGACALLGDDGPPLVCADAFADPIAGLYAALGALACLVGRRGALLDVALREVVTHVLSDSDGRRTGRAPTGVRASAPRAREPVAPGPRLGEHTATVLAELGLERLE
jgi:crotonobetainyl-CoA:carnitine CoA-transferase CaiB-like acyl-CoA transferase